MAVEFVLTIVAGDRPGLVNAIAEAVARHGGNWVDSAMARLGGAFAGIVRVTVDDAKSKALIADLAALGQAGIAVTAARTSAAPSPAGARAQLVLTCSDLPGIVRAISAALAGLGVSIETLDTRVFAGSMSGDHLFEAKASVILPPSLPESELRQALEAIAQDLMADITWGAPAQA
jgi:glycine cleavage system regulatory protein